MPDDMSLRSATDYSKGQKEAAYAVLGEIVNLLEPEASWRTYEAAAAGTAIPVG